MSNLIERYRILSMALHKEPKGEARDAIEDELHRLERLKPTVTLQEINNSHILAVIKYYEDDGSMCGQCSYFIQQPDINFYSCQIIEGDIMPSYAPCLTEGIKLVGEDNHDENSET